MVLRCAARLRVCLRVRDVERLGRMVPITNRPHFTRRCVNAEAPPGRRTTALGLVTSDSGAPDRPNGRRAAHDGGACIPTCSKERFGRATAEAKPGKQKNEFAPAAEVGGQPELSTARPNVQSLDA